MAGDTLVLTNENFDTEVDHGTALVDFYATWCGPCKVIAPILDEMAKTYKAQGLKVGKVDIDQATELAARFGIQGVPTLMFFKDGKKVDQIVGAQPKPVIEKKIKALIGQTV